MKLSMTLRPNILLGLLLLPTLACSKKTADKPMPKSVSPKGKVKKLGPEDQAIADMAIKILAADQKIDAGRIQVDTVRPVEWRDSSLGCPAPDQAYMQVISPGHKITLRVGKKLFFVHESRGKGFVCKRTKAQSGAGGTIELVWGEQALAARADLAKRLGVPEKDIRVASALKQKWPDNSLGCEGAVADVKKGEVEGYIIKLMRGSQNFFYHTDLDRVFPCPPITVD